MQPEVVNHLGPGKRDPIWCAHTNCFRTRISSSKHTDRIHLRKLAYLQISRLQLFALFLAPNLSSVLSTINAASWVCQPFEAEEEIPHLMHKNKLFQNPHPIVQTYCIHLRKLAPSNAGPLAFWQSSRQPWIKGTRITYDTKKCTEFFLRQETIGVGPKHFLGDWNNALPKNAWTSPP